MGLWSWRRRFYLEMKLSFMPSKGAAASAEIERRERLRRFAFETIDLAKYPNHLGMPMIQNLETTLRAGAVPQVPQFRPPVVQPPQLVITTNVKTSDNKVKFEEPPTVKLAKQQKYS